MTRVGKKIFYGALFVCFGALTVWFFYSGFLRLAPTCADGWQNQNEEGIDCGGACPKPCFLGGLKPVRVHDRPYLFALPNGKTAALFSLINTNSDYAAKAFEYEVIFLNAAGQIKEQIKKMGRIYAGEQRYVLAASARSFFADTAMAELKILGSPEWEEGRLFQKPRLTVGGVRLVQEASYPEIKGVITNNEARDIMDAEVLAVLHDRFGLPVFAALTIITRLPAGAASGFVIALPGQFDWRGVSDDQITVVAQ